MAMLADAGGPQAARMVLVPGVGQHPLVARLILKLPYSHSFTPATLAGGSLLSAGRAYVAMALAARKAA